MTNCKNCGAVLTGGKCEYCGTEYETISRAPINPRIYPRSINAYNDLNDDQLGFIMKRFVDVFSVNEMRGVLYR